MNFKNILWFFMASLSYRAVAVTELIIPKKHDFLRLPNDDTYRVGRYTNVRIGKDGPIISFNDQINNSIRVVKFSAYNMKNMSDVVIDSQPQGDNARFLRMEINPQTKQPYFAYISGEKKATMLAFCEDFDCMKPQIKEIYAKEASHPSLAFRPTTGYPVIAYTALPDKRMFVTMCQDLTCLSSKTINISRGNKPILGDYIHVEIGKDNVPVFSWFAAGSKVLKYARCTDKDCSDFDIALVDGTSNNGLYNFMRLDEKGNAIILYTDVGHGYLKTAYCDDALCSKPIITVIDNNIGSKELVRGVFPEVAINPKNNLPVLSFVSQPNDATGAPQGILKVAQCIKSDCSEVLLQEIARGGYGYGRDTSLAFQGDLIYLTFLDYNANYKKAYLAVLRQQK